MRWCRKNFRCAPNLPQSAALGIKLKRNRRNIEESINSVEVTIDDLLEATEDHQLPPEDRNWKGRAHLMAMMFKGQPHKAMSIDSRLTAMSAMIESGKLLGWALPEQENGSYNIVERVWQVTSTLASNVCRKTAMF